MEMSSQEDTIIITSNDYKCVSLMAHKLYIEIIEPKMLENKLVRVDCRIA